MNLLPQNSTRIPNSNIMIQKIVMTKLNRKASAISSTMKGTKNLVKTMSYSIQHFYHPDHSEIQRRAVPKFHSSLVHILFQHSAWQRLAVHFSKIPGKNNKKKRSDRDLTTLSKLIVCGDLPDSTLQKMSRHRKNACQGGCALHRGQSAP